LILIEETDTRFYLDESTIKNAGLGVFAKEAIKVGERIEIIGVAVKYGSVADQCTAYANNYKFSATAKNADRKIVPVGYGGMVNHTNDLDKQNVHLDHSKSNKNHPHAGQAIYTFFRNVRSGEEILGNYGDDWDNLLEWKEKNKSFAEEGQNEWETFLSFDLYKLGILSKQIMKGEHA